MNKPDQTLNRFWDIRERNLLDLLEATPAGLTSAEAKRRLRLHGPNSLVGESRFAALISFLRFFANPLVLILLAASTISIMLRDAVGGTIIIAIVLLSVIVKFLRGVPGSTCRGGYSPTGGHHRRGSARSTGTGVAGRGTGPRGRRDSGDSRGAEKERCLRRDHDRRQPVRDAEGGPRCRTSERPPGHRQPGGHNGRCPLAYQAEHGAIFARVSPEQKNRVILGLKARGHVVGYIGDGINDAPTLHTADVGISVMNGVDVAKRCREDHPAGEGPGGFERRGDRGAALLRQHHVVHPHEQQLELRQYVLHGRGVALPAILPMRPTQSLLINFLYDTSQVPGDNVDPALLHQTEAVANLVHPPVHDDHRPISSINDFLTFGVLLWLFHASTNAPLFRTGWFMESLATQTLVVFVIRTAGNPFRSRPSGRLLIGVVAVAATGAVLPYTGPGAMLGFAPIPLL